MNNEQQTALAMTAYVLASPFVFAVNPRKTLHMLNGGGWYDGHCSCTRPDAMNPTCAVHGWT